MYSQVLGVTMWASGGGWALLCRPHWGHCFSWSPRQVGPKRQLFRWQCAWETASIFAEFEEVEKEASLSLAGCEVCQIPCFFVGPSWSFDDPSWVCHRGLPSQGCWGLGWRWRRAGSRDGWEQLGWAAREEWGSRGTGTGNDRWICPLGGRK